MNTYILVNVMHNTEVIDPYHQLVYDEIHVIMKVCVSFPFRINLITPQQSGSPGFIRINFTSGGADANNWRISCTVGLSSCELPIPSFRVFLRLRIS